MSLSSIYNGTRVLLTGDTGFKGGYLAWWLHRLGAKVWGYSLPPEHPEGVFAASGLAQVISHSDGDLCDLAAVRSLVEQVRPQIVFHLAAQALVRRSYATPVPTLAANVLGTAHVLEAVRLWDHPCAVVTITSDKCYDNDGSARPCREDDPMGGADVYSASKGCAELVCAAYRQSFFAPSSSGVHMATARAGNVFGPGDWAEGRLLPDAARALRDGQPLALRNPQSLRPWQHVLECLSGYLCLGSRLLSEEAEAFACAWNFGPLLTERYYVSQVADLFFNAAGGGRWVVHNEPVLHEAPVLQLDSDKSMRRLAWRPVWPLELAIRRTAEGYCKWMQAGSNAAAVRGILNEEIEAYSRSALEQGLNWMK